MNGSAKGCLEFDKGHKVHRTGPKVFDALTADVADKGDDFIDMAGFVHHADGFENADHVLFI